MKPYTPEANVHTVKKRQLFFSFCVKFFVDEKATSGSLTNHNDGGRSMMSH